MFTLQNQNQVCLLEFSSFCTITTLSIFQAFVTLSSISAKITTRQNVFYKKTSAQKATQNTSFLCLDSFLEAVKNCDFTFARHLKTQTLLDSKILNNFRVSYVSNDSFYENKHGFSEKYLNSNVPTLIFHRHDGFPHIPQKFYRKLVSSLLHENHCSFNIQLRGFKTDRSVKAELQRNPPLVTRVKNVFGVSQYNPQPDPKVQPTPASMEKLKQMLGNEESLSESEKQRIKVAFAEGYLLGNNSNTKMGRTQKYFKTFTQIITVFIFLAVIISLMASASGSVFR